MISIVMPAYHAGQYIEASIQSVLNQTYRSWELLIIDDGSSDNTGRIAEAYAAQYPNIHYHRNVGNLGVAESRNLGVSMAAGEWIAYLDSDDCWHPEKLQKQIKLAGSSRAEFLFTGSAFMNEYGQTLDYYLPAPKTVSYRELLKQNVVSCSSVMIKKELAQQYPMKHASQMHEDFAVWLQILREKKICAYGVDEPLLIYRLSTNSKSGNKIKAGMMTFRVYRYLGISLIPALYYFSYYFIRSVRKYRHLR